MNRHDPYNGNKHDCYGGSRVAGAEAHLGSERHRASCGAELWRLYFTRDGPNQLASLLFCLGE